jgi:hypothetical protein
MKTVKGITASIYSNGFVDSYSPIKDAKQVTIINEGVELFEPSEQAPAVRIVRRNINGSEYIHAEPLRAGMYAFGGRYIHCSDSRVRSINKYPIPLHDRNMNLEN